MFCLRAKTGQDHPIGAGRSTETLKEGGCFFALPKSVPKKQEIVLMLKTPLGFGDVFVCSLGAQILACFKSALGFVSKMIEFQQVDVARCQLALVDMALRPPIPAMKRCKDSK